MKVAIAGGHGQIARRLTRLLAADGHEVLALIRNPDHTADVEDDGATAVVIDIEAVDADAVAEAIDASDAVVFAAGAGPGSGPERKETMDYGGAAKLIEAARATGVGHYEMVSSIGADANASEGSMAPYLRAKGKADEALRASGVQYTIVRPGSLTDDPGTGKVKLEAPGFRGGKIPRDDVAAVLAAGLVRGPANTTFVLIGGDEDIETALASLP
jgi:uncharacterized protein YbjT (DUF2867 family)